MRKLLLLWVGCLFLSMQVLAQNRVITGKATDEKANPIPNASVNAKGTTIGTVTKADGSFSLTVPETVKALVISAVDMNAQEIDITNRSEVTLTLLAKDKTMQEVVVVGYGTQ